MNHVRAAFATVALVLAAACGDNRKAPGSLPSVTTTPADAAAEASRTDADITGDEHVSPSRDAPGDWGACQGPGWCGVVAKGCCGGPCGLAKIDDVEAVNRDPLLTGDFGVQTCTDTAAGCEPCTSRIDSSVTAVCETGRCKKIDVRTDPMSACGSDGDCELRFADCCSSCGTADLLVAIAKAERARYLAEICSPLDTAKCPAPCATPADRTARCAGGHCEVAATNEPCPAEAPPATTVCHSLASSACEYGKDIRPSCRVSATCSAGTWSVAQPGCAALPGAGQSGCPADVTANDTACTGNVGLLCDMAGSSGAAAGSMCACVAGVERWTCLALDIDGACPSLVPGLGSTCLTPMTCPYGVCGTTAAAGRECASGVWVDATSGCP
jgi:hypothetical protein